MYIESSHNPRVRTWSQLKSRKGRQTTGCFLVEGVRLVDELLSSQLAVEAVLWDVGSHVLPDGLQAKIAERRVSVVELSPAAFTAIADTTTPQGVMAVAAVPSVRAQGPAADGGLTLLLDGVQDPGNVGTLLRSAEAFGVRHVCCSHGTSDPFAPKAVRASMGGIFRVAVSTGPASTCIAAWRQRHAAGQVVATTTDATLSCHEAEFSRPSLLMIGSEASGLSPEALRLADVRVRIPMEGAAESLNAAVAGAIVLYEAHRQRIR